MLTCKAYYFLIVVDARSHAIWVYLLRVDSKVGKCLVDFNKIVEPQLQKKVNVYGEITGWNLIRCP